MPTRITRNLVAALAFVCIACGPMPKPKPPTPPVSNDYTAAMTVVTESGAVPEGLRALLTVDGPGDHGNYVGTTDAGQVKFAVKVPPTPNGLYGGWVELDAPDLAQDAVRVTLTGKTGQLRDKDNANDVYVTMRPKHFDPSTLTEEQLLHFRGEFVGLMIDEIKPACPEDPVTHIRCTADNGQVPRGHAAGLLFTANYRLYTKEQRQVIRDVYRGRRADATGFTPQGYTHFPISAFCTGRWEYHGLFPPCNAYAQLSLNDALHELYDDGLIPVPFILDDTEPNDLTSPIQVVESGVDKSLIRIAIPFWEHELSNCALLKVHRAFPDALIGYHNPVFTDAPYGDPCFGGTGEADYPGAGAVYTWLKANAGLRFLALQTDQVDVGAQLGHIADFLASFSSGPRVCRVACGWPSGISVNLFEDVVPVYDTFWSGGNTKANRARSDEVLRAAYLKPICTDQSRNRVDSSAWCGRLDGFAAGGTVSR